LRRRLFHPEQFSRLATPDWSLLGIEHAPELPAVRWRQQKLDTLAPIARATLDSRLATVLSK
jgi:hypothetical protein